MYARRSKLNKIPLILPVVPVYLIVFTVVLSFTKYIFLNYNVNKEIYDNYSFGSFLFILPSSIVFYICATMTIICHSKAMLLHPGTVNPKFNFLIDKADNNKNIISSFCSKCNKHRPERAHHCKICKMCILKYDHHCPWIANCIGVNNQKYFLQFLFYAVIGNLIAFMCLLTKVFNVNLRKNNIKDHSILGVFYAVSDKLILICGTILSIAMVISIGYLLYIMTSLILHNATTVETLKLKYGEYPKYYDKNKFNSWRIVMGFNWKEWFIPKISLNKYNNGYTFGKLNDIINIENIKDILNDNNSNYESDKKCINDLDNKDYTNLNSDQCI